MPIQVFCKDSAASEIHDEKLSSWLSSLCLEVREEIHHKHVLLKLWEQTTGPGSKGVVDQLLALPDKPWNRLAELLFSVDQELVQAVTGLIESLSKLQLQSCCELESPALPRLFTRVMSSSWSPLLQNKVRDVLEHHRLDRNQPNEDDADQVVGAFKLLAAIVRIWCRSEQSGDPNESEQLGAVVALLVAQWQQFLFLRPRQVTPLVFVTQQLCRVIDLVESDSRRRHVQAQLVSNGLLLLLVRALDLADLRLASSRNEHQLKLQLLTSQLDLVMRLVRQNHEVSLSLVQENSTLVTQLRSMIHAPYPPIQCGALQCINAVMEAIAQDEKAVLRVTADLRVAGFLMELSWLFGHQYAQVAAAAAHSMELMLNHSPRVEMLRALVEQGCIFIFEWLVHQRQQRSSQSNAEEAVGHRMPKAVLQWILQELDARLFVVFLRGTLSSTNLLLKKNVVWGLLLLHRRARLQAKSTNQPGMTTPLDAQEAQDPDQAQEIQRVLQLLLDAEDHGALAISLLQLCALCCDKCSTIKLTGAAGRAVPPPSLPPPPKAAKLTRSCSFANPNKVTTSNQAIASSSWVQLVFCCQGDETLCVTKSSALALVFKNCKVFSSRKNTRQGVSLAELDDGSVQVRLDDVAKPTLALMLELLAVRCTEEAASRLDGEQLSRLAALLVLSKRLDCAALWHVATMSLTDRLQATTWLAILELALHARHPSLMLRAVRFAIDQHHQCQQQQQQQSELTDGSTLTLKQQLVRATLEIIDELFFCSITGG